MQTRLQKKLLDIENKNVKYEFDYDFDDASKCWKENKKYIGNGCYKYLCEGKTKKGIKCTRVSLDGELYCRMHLHK